MLLDKIKDSCNCTFLLFFRVTETGSVDVNMKSTGVNLVAEVTKADGFLRDFFPREEMAVVIHSHRVREHLKPFIQRAIVFDVHLISGDQMQLLNYYKTEKKLSFLELILGETEIFRKNYHFSAL